MSEIIGIRVARLADLGALVTLYSAFRDSLQKSTPSPEQFRDSLGRLLLLPESRIYVAAAERGDVGYAALRLLESAWSSRKEAMFEDLFVDSGSRGLGIGKQLVEFAIRDAAEHGCGSMFLDTNERNESSNALYRRLGFTCERARWGGGRQIRYDLNIEPAKPCKG